MSYECGLVGLPNVGKSTIFNILTKSKAPSENYPFCTIEPNVGVVEIDDPRLLEIGAIVKPERVRRSSVRFVDIAGLVKDAHQGEGLGNQFLHHIRNVDAIAHVLRVFDDPQISHVYGDVNPLRDLEIVESELILADLQTVEKSLEKLGKEMRVGKTEGRVLLENLEKLKGGLERGQRALNFIGDDKETNNYIKNLLTGKPYFVILNISEDELNDERQVEKLESIILMFAEQNIPTVPFCVPIEEAIREMSPEEKKQTLLEYNMPMSGVDLTCFAGLKSLNLITFFTAGPKEVASWNVRQGTSALEAASKIHTDISKGFIKAEVIAFEDYVNCRGEQGAKADGKLRLEGRDYIVQDGDIIYFRFNKSI
ncbi:MAG: redox-regulated ATPase YchF [Deltaproteobacteria bacterium]|nr:redox-regulated ATPase YchF [Deltaproteobacteria bacterium]